ncbi:FAD-dependent oxidoreductase [Streptomyces sp. NPDC053493]|uniref:FAD-dependent oxidoreductase n=1 Tax=Streptomyces sp. NPDC053493 TaxID=3365705 RepID=UPI0037CCF983
MPHSNAETAGTAGTARAGGAAETARADLAVVGAGPAGLAAAVTAADLGLSVVLLDAGAGPGGQYYRRPAAGLGAARPQALHHDWTAFTTRLRRLRDHEAARRVTCLTGTHVWTVLPGHGHDHGTGPGDGDGTGAAGGDRRGVGGASWTLHARTTRDGEDTATTVTARAVLLATGAYERQLPFPGWTLPGVLGAGGAQAMLKSGLVLPGRRVVVAGSGPLLLAVAASLASAGARVPAVVEAGAYTAYSGHAPTLLRNPAKLLEAARFGAALARHHTRLLTRHAVVAAHGTDRVEAVTVARLDRDWRPLPGTARRVPCDAVAVGHGLVPELSLATALGCATRQSPDGTVALALSDDQRTSVPGIWAAGETGGIGGAQLALVEGELAARAIAGAAPGTLASLGRRRDRLRAFAAAMAAAHRPGEGWTDWLRADTDVCRCEEVSVGAVREAAGELGAHDARTVKLLTRAGMGWCQGRMCGPAVAALCGAGAAPDRRPLACPVPLRHLARLPEES